eukprot:3283145-Prymnesium_polylepis.1
MEEYERSRTPRLQAAALQYYIAPLKPLLRASQRFFKKNTAGNGPNPVSRRFSKARCSTVHVKGRAAIATGVPYL